MKVRFDGWFYRFVNTDAPVIPDPGNPLVMFSSKEPSCWMFFAISCPICRVEVL